MKRFLDLADLSDDAARATCSTLARALEARPALATRSPARVVGLRLHEPVAAHARLDAGRGGAARRHAASSSRRGRAAGSSRRATAWSWTATRSSTCARRSRCSPSTADALGVRCFAEGNDLADRPRRRASSARWPRSAPKPLINLESAVAHPCQALADWKTLDDCEIPRAAARFVLSWAKHPKAAAATRCPPSALAHGGAARHGGRRAAARGLRAARRRSWTAARALAAQSGGTRRRDRRPRARRWTARTCSTPSRGPRRSTTAAREERALRAPLARLVRRRALVRAGARRTRSSCTACRCAATSRSPTRCSTGRAAWWCSRRTTGCTRRRRCCVEMLAEEASVTRPHDREATIGARCKRALPYIRLYRGRDLRRQARRRGGAATRRRCASVVEQVGVLSRARHPRGRWSTAAGRRRRRWPSGSGLRDADGRRPAGDRRRDARGRGHDDGRHGQHRAARRLPRARGSPAVGALRRRRRPRRARRRRRRVRRSSTASRRSVDYGQVGDIDAVDRPVLAELLDGGFVPVVSPLAADDAGQRAQRQRRHGGRGARAARSGAEKLIFLTDACRGSSRTATIPRSLVSYTDLRGLAALEGARRARRRDAAQGRRPRAARSGRRGARAHRRLRGSRRAARRGLHQRGVGHAGRPRPRGAAPAGQAAAPRDGRRMTDAELLALHRELVGDPVGVGTRRGRSSRSSGAGSRAPRRRRRADRRQPRRARAARRPLLCLNTPPRHRAGGAGLDARPPRRRRSTTGAVFGLGSNDAKARWRR